MVTHDMSKNTVGIEALMTQLSTCPNVPLIFQFGDTTINQGYHVTEVKYARIKSLDCGSHTEDWDELLIQLLDGSVNSEQGFMSTTKFAGILGASLASLSTTSDPAVFFEYSPNNGPLFKLAMSSIQSNSEGLAIILSDEKAVCKPFERFGLAGSALAGLTGIPAKVAKEGCCSTVAKCCQ